MLKLKITLTRSPSLHEYGPEEDEVLGVYLNVRFTYDLLFVDGEEVGIYDDEKGVWWVEVGVGRVAFSDIHIEPIELADED